MKVTPLKNYVASNIDLEAQPELELPTEGNAKALLMNMIISNQYADPLKSACREAIQNALDANKEANKQHLPISINLPTPEEPQLTISDNGNGIDAERFNTVYKTIGRSTKSSDNNLMGGYGMGRLSMLAVASQVLINSVADGIYYQHSAFIKESGNIGFATFSAEPTLMPSGTSVIIPIDPKYHLEVKKHIKELTEWVEQPVEVYFYGELCDNIQKTEDWSVKDCFQNCNWYLKPYPNCTYVSITLLQGDLPYQLSEKLYRDLEDHIIGSNSLWRLSNENCNSLVIRMPVGSLELTQSREDLRISDRNTKALKFIPLLLEQVTAKLQETLVNQADFRQVLKTFYLYHPLSEFEFKGRRFTKQSIKYSNKDAFKIGEYEDVFSKRCTLIWGSEYWTKTTLERICKLSLAASPLILECKANILHFLDSVWLVYPEGTSKAKFEFKVRQALNISNDKHILCIPTDKDPEEYINSHPLLSLLEDVLIYQPIEKEGKYKPKPPSFRSLVKGGGARTLLDDATSLFPGVYNCTQKVFDLPDSGVFIETEKAKNCLALNHIPKWFNKSELFFVSESIAERLRKDPYNWVSFSDYCKEEFVKLITNYKEGLELLNWSIDSDWVSGSYYFCGLPCNELLAGIIKNSVIEKHSQESKQSLINLLLNPNKAFWLSKIADSKFISVGEDKELYSIKNKLKDNNWFFDRHINEQTVQSPKIFSYLYRNEYEALKVPLFKELAQKYPLLMLLIQKVEVGTMEAITKENLPLAERNLLESIHQYMEQINAIHN
jgi:hypothetical protein